MNKNLYFCGTRYFVNIYVRGSIVADHTLSANFNYFFKRLNPSPKFVQQAAREHESIRSLIESPNGQASVLSPKCFLQGSYKQDTAIYAINDVDLVVLCELWQPGSGGTGGRSFNRDEIFDIIASPLKSDRRYKDKIRYNTGSMCIKVDLGIKVEILPVVYKQDNYEPTQEPFRLYRPEKKLWEDGYARYHKQWLTWKNKLEKTGGNFKPAIKIFKHLRSLYKVNAVSFHIESLLFALPDSLFLGNPAEYITTILNYFAKWSAGEWYRADIKTPCGEKNIFSDSEWDLYSWYEFHKLVQLWARCANLASSTQEVNVAIELWQLVLGENYFPKQVTL
jgi:hypothetical protein